MRDEVIFLANLSRENIEGNVQGKNRRDKGRGKGVRTDKK